MFFTIAGDMFGHPADVHPVLQLLSLNFVTDQLVRFNAYTLSPALTN